MKVFIAVISACVVLMVMLMLMQGLVVGDDGVLGEMMIFKLRLRWLWRRLQSPIIWYKDLLVIGVKRLGKLNSLRLLLGLLLKVVSLKRLPRTCHIHIAAVRLLLRGTTRRIVQLLL